MAKTKGTTYNKTNLIEAIAKSKKITKLEAEKCINNTFSGIEDILGSMEDGDKLQLVGLITFEVVAKPAREGRNPRTGKPVQIEAKNALKITAGSQYKEAVQ